MKYNPLLLIDFYKATHHEQYPKGLTKMTSYYTPRMSRIAEVKEVPLVMLQSFIKEILIDGFNENFFNRPVEEVMLEYTRVLNATLGNGSYDPNKIVELHKLGYLPLQISAVPEGMFTKIGTPQLEITNTHPNFVWLVNTIETMLSCSIWHAQISAWVGWNYRQIVNKYHEISCDNNVRAARLLGDFSMRGQHSIDSAIHSSAAWCMSFLNTATVPAIMYLEDYYNCDCTKDEVAFGLISTEHSVMCSNFAVDGDEITQVKRLLTEIYPKTSFSMVSDSYDYDNLIDNILPECYNEIMNHEGFIGIRGDSGDPVEVVTQTVFKLWDLFGGTLNSKGFKVLNPHVKAIYGDSITPQRCNSIYKILVDNNFSIENVSLGVGSFSMMCLEDIKVSYNFDGRNNIISTNSRTTYNPYTRDTFGVAVKATYAENENNKPIPIFKNPKGASFKKSQKGYCVVYPDGTYEDNLTCESAGMVRENVLTTVFEDGDMVKEYTLNEVRARLHNGNF